MYVAATSAIPCVHIYVSIANLKFLVKQPHLHICKHTCNHSSYNGMSIIIIIICGISTISTYKHTRNHNNQLYGTYVNYMWHINHIYIIHVTIIIYSQLVCQLVYDKLLKLTCPIQLAFGKWSKSHICNWLDLASTLT